MLNLGHLVPVTLLRATQVFELGNETFPLTSGNLPVTDQLGLQAGHVRRIKIARADLPLS